MRFILAALAPQRRRGGEEKERRRRGGEEEKRRRRGEEEKRRRRVSNSLATVRDDYLLLKAWALRFREPAPQQHK
jgi:hypothetical protein